MPIKVSDPLPAIETLNNENIFVITETRALTQDIRPLEIAVLNLMPTKIATETQLLRVLGNTPLQIRNGRRRSRTGTGDGRERRGWNPSGFPGRLFQYTPRCGNKRGRFGQSARKRGPKLWRSAYSYLRKWMFSRRLSQPPADISWGRW